VIDGIPGTFTMGGICAGASGRFLEMTAKRLGVDITELGPLAMKGMARSVPMNSYCIVFGTQSLVNALAAGSSREDVAAAALPQRRRAGLRASKLQEIDIKEPVIMVRRHLADRGVVYAMGQLSRPRSSSRVTRKYIGAVGSALLASGFVKGIRCPVKYYFVVESPDAVGRDAYERIAPMFSRTSISSR
jgi:activator of 2-hydroxyglutaryl-CoA dehydratase